MKLLKVVLLIVTAVSVPEIVFKGKTMPNVTFSHKFHAGTRQISCETCHSSLLPPYEEKAKKENKSLRDVIDKNFCRNCHNGKVAFSTEDNNNCKRCHHEKNK